MPSHNNFFIDIKKEKREKKRGEKEKERGTSPWLDRIFVNSHTYGSTRRLAAPQCGLQNERKSDAKMRSNHCFNFVLCRLHLTCFSAHFCIIFSLIL